jgi:hypothetical protein
VLLINACSFTPELKSPRDPAKKEIDGTNDAKGKQILVDY